MERQVRENTPSRKDQYKRFLYRSRRPTSAIRTHVPGGIYCTGAEPEGKIPYRGFFCVYSEELENAHAAILRCNDLTCISEAPVPHAHFGHDQECRALEGREFDPNVMKFEARLRKFHHIMNGEDSLQEEFVDILVAIHNEGNHTFSSRGSVVADFPPVVCYTLKMPGQFATWKQLGKLHKFWKVAEETKPSGQVHEEILKLIHPHQRLIMTPIVKTLPRDLAFLNLVGLNFPDMIRCAECIEAWMISIIKGCQICYNSMNVSVSYKRKMPEYIERVRKQIGLHWAVLESMSMSGDRAATLAFARVKCQLRAAAGLNAVSTRWLDQIPDCWDYFWAMHVLLTYGRDFVLPENQEFTLKLDWHQIAMQEDDGKPVALFQNKEAADLVQDVMCVFHRRPPIIVSVPSYVKY